MTIAAKYESSSIAGSCCRSVSCLMRIFVQAWSFGKDWVTSCFSPGKPLRALSNSQFLISLRFDNISIRIPVSDL